MKYYIYGLYEEGKEEIIRYVGKTNKQDLQKRLNEHINESFRENGITHKRNWIKSIVNNGYKINIKCLEESDFENLSDREIFWISKLPNLTNTTEGGTGGHGVLYTISYEECKKYIQENYNIKSISEWEKTELPNFITKNPREVYLNRGWTSWGDFLGTGRIQDNKKSEIYISYDKAKEYVKNLQINTIICWKESVKNNLIPNFIPNRPERFYKKRGWISWGDFLGTGRIANQNKKEFFISYEECSKFAKENKIKSIKQWRNFLLPIYVPKDPRLQYKNCGWIDWGEFLGTGRLQDNLLVKNYISYDESREWVKNNLLNIKSEKMWRECVKNNKIPIFIPNHPELYYNRKNRGWMGWKDFLSK